MLVCSVDQPSAPPLTMPDRFKLEIHYFKTPAGDPGVPELGPNEFFIRQEDALKWQEDMVVEIVSPLDAASKAELELTEDQERWIDWLVEHQTRVVRLDTQ